MKTLLTFILIASFFISCRQPESQQKPETRLLVKTSVVDSQKFAFPVRASGIVVPASEIKLSFKTGGIIDRVLFEEGARVKKGTLLATLNMSEIDAQVLQAENGFEKASRDLARAKNLYADSVITLELYQNAQTAYNVAGAVLEAARFNRQHSSILAPDDGVILKRLAEAHEMIAAGYPVFVLGTTGGHWKIKAGLADRDYVRISTGDRAKVTFDAYPGKEYSARVSQITEAANLTTGTYELEMDLDDIPQKLATGFIANVEITPSGAESYYKIPVESLVEAEGKTGFVFTVDDSSKVHKKKVEISGIYDTWIAVDGGINGNETLVTEGSAYLSDGDKVTVVK
ncbi:MAG TPA: efflux RND transporter periplasmic adaptor subunit [Bacteroidales bacterium]|nr:efflux RND transporter periplasmic adaptor subunit [Bacteroidales bacterium]